MQVRPPPSPLPFSQREREQEKVFYIFVKPITSFKNGNTCGTLHANKLGFDRGTKRRRNFRPVNGATLRSREGYETITIVRPLNQQEVPIFRGKYLVTITYRYTGGISIIRPAYGME